MDWLLIANLIIKEGLPLAQAIFTKWSSGKPPTDADFAELRALASQTAADRVKFQLAAAGIPLDSARALELLALIAGGKTVAPPIPPAPLTGAAVVTVSSPDGVSVTPVPKDSSVGVVITPP